VALPVISKKDFTARVMLFLPHKFGYIPEIPMVSSLPSECPGLHCAGAVLGHTMGTSTARSTAPMNPMGFMCDHLHVTGSHGNLLIVACKDGGFKQSRMISRCLIRRFASQKPIISLTRYDGCT